MFIVLFYYNTSDYELPSYNKVLIIYILLL